MGDTASGIRDVLQLELEIYVWFPSTDLPDRAVPRAAIQASGARRLKTSSRAELVDIQLVWFVTPPAAEPWPAPRARN